MYFDHKSDPVALKSCPKNPNFCMLKGGGISIWVYGYYEHTKAFWIIGSANIF